MDVDPPEFRRLRPFDLSAPRAPGAGRRARIYHGPPGRRRGPVHSTPERTPVPRLSCPSNITASLWCGQNNPRGVAG